uniref:Uncharacterized protein n=1 Tax=Arundo donax TaxID=35708 RepID=A0A0A9HSJ4_ARUDO
MVTQGGKCFVFKFTEVICIHTSKYFLIIFPTKKHPNFELYMPAFSELKYKHQDAS